MAQMKQMVPTLRPEQSNSPQPSSSSKSTCNLPGMPCASCNRTELARTDYIGPNGNNLCSWCNKCWQEAGKPEDLNRSPGSESASPAGKSTPTRRAAPSPMAPTSSHHASHASSIPSTSLIRASPESGAPMRAKSIAKTVDQSNQNSSMVTRDTSTPEPTSRRPENEKTTTPKAKEHSARKKDKEKGKATLSKPNLASAQTSTFASANPDTSIAVAQEPPVQMESLDAMEINPRKPRNKALGQSVERTMERRPESDSKDLHINKNKRNSIHNPQVIDGDEDIEGTHNNDNRRNSKHNPHLIDSDDDIHTSNGQQVFPGSERQKKTRETDEERKERMKRTRALRKFGKKTMPKMASNDGMSAAALVDAAEPMPEGTAATVSALATEIHDTDADVAPAANAQSSARANANDVQPSIEVNNDHSRLSVDITTRGRGSSRGRSSVATMEAAFSSQTTAQDSRSSSTQNINQRGRVVVEDEGRYAVPDNLQGTSRPLPVPADEEFDVPWFKLRPCRMLLPCDLSIVLNGLDTVRVMTNWPGAPKKKKDDGPAEEMCKILDIRQNAHGENFLLVAWWWQRGHVAYNLKGTGSYLSERWPTHKTWKYVLGMHFDVITPEGLLGKVEEGEEFCNERFYGLQHLDYELFTRKADDQYDRKAFIKNWRGRGGKQEATAARMKREAEMKALWNTFWPEDGNELWYCGVGEKLEKKRTEEAKEEAKRKAREIAEEATGRTGSAAKKAKIVNPSDDEADKDDGMPVDHVYEQRIISKDVDGVKKGFWADGAPINKSKWTVQGADAPQNSVSTQDRDHSAGGDNSSDLTKLKR